MAVLLVPGGGRRRGDRGGGIQLAVVVVRAGSGRGGCGCRRCGGRGSRR